METRILVAAAIGLVTIIVFGWVAVAKYQKRQQFKLRQQGRGKSVGLREGEMQN